VPATQKEIDYRNKMGWNEALKHRAVISQHPEPPPT
jgi:hypothetical protein